MLIPCDCVGGFNMVTEFSEENLGNAFRDDDGHWWTKCGDCDGTGQQIDEDLAVAILGGLL
jgi:hypothetical protein